MHAPLSLNTTLFWFSLIQFSALAGVTVNLEHPTSLQQLNELGVLTDVKVEAILRLSE